jgi:hypothetical protein
MLIQHPAVFQNSTGTGTDLKTKTILKGIKKYYPDLIHSEKYKGYQGILIAKKSYDGKDIALDEMGRILGYPCYKDFSDFAISENDFTYGISIFAIGLKQEVELFTNICKDKDVQIQMKQFAKKAEEVFHTYQALKSIRLEVRVRVNVPTLSLINTLLEKNTLNKESKDQIRNIIWNMAQVNPDVIAEQFNREIQYDNPVHQGILLNILLCNYNDPLSPFYPLQFHKEQSEVTEILSKQMNNLIAILHRTRTTKRSRTRRS